MQYVLRDRGTECIHVDASCASTLPESTIEAMEDFDLIYRTLCAVLYNFVPTSGHPGGSISSGRLAAGLIFQTLACNFSRPDDRSADILTYAAGHKAMGLYAMWACRNEIMRISNPEMLPSVKDQLRLEDLLGFRKNRTTRTPLFLRYEPKPLDGHPAPFVPFVPTATGASGVGFATAVGLAWALKDLYRSNAPFVHALEGEGGLTPGRVQEAAAAAASAGLGNFICHVDWNQASIDSNRVCGEKDIPGDYVQWNPEELFMLHGFNVISVADGKDFRQIRAAQQSAATVPPQYPTAVIYRTVKGWRYGIEGSRSHGAGHAFCSPEYFRALAPFEERFRVKFPPPHEMGTPEQTEESFFRSLLVFRDVFENNPGMTSLLGSSIRERCNALKNMRREMRPDSPQVEKIFSMDPEKRPKECLYPPGTSCTLRGALGDVLRHLNTVTGGAIIVTAADLYASTNVSNAGSDFPSGFYHSSRNPSSRILSAGGIAEDAMGGIISGISTAGSHMGVGSSYGAFIAPLHMISARLHAIGLQARQDRNKSRRFTPFISINAHAGVKTGEDGPTHAEPNSLQILQENFPGRTAITLTPWEPMELWPLMICALKKRPAIIAPFVTRPGEKVPDRAALGLAPAEASMTGVYRLMAAEGKPDGVLVYQGSDVTFAFIEDVLPEIRKKGINLEVYYVAGVELFDSLPLKERNRIFPASAAGRSMGVTGFTLPTMYRWVTSKRGRAHTLHPFRKGRYLGSGAAVKVMEEAGLDGESQYRAILQFIGA